MNSSYGKFDASCVRDIAFPRTSTRYALEFLIFPWMTVAGICQQVQLYDIADKSAEIDAKPDANKHYHVCFLIITTIGYQLSNRKHASLTTIEIFSEQMIAIAIQQDFDEFREIQINLNHKSDLFWNLYFYEKKRFQRFEYKNIFRFFKSLKISPNEIC